MNTMNKKRYFVSVPAKIISESIEFSDHPFEIMATSDELVELQVLLQSDKDFDISETARMPINAFSPEDEDVAPEYDENLIKIYRMIHELGTLKTKVLIDETGILDN